MSAFSDVNFFKAIESGMISIYPVVPDNIQPGSIDLTLHNIIEILDETDKLNPIDASSETLKSELKKHVKEIDITGGHILHPGDFCIGYSAEKIKLNKLVNGCLYNRNSLVRIGIDATLTAYINPGFSGRKMIGIRNIGKCDIIIAPGMRICQLVLHTLLEEAKRGYSERHDTSKISQSAEHLPTEVVEQKYIDTSLSDFMNERIEIAASRI